MFSGKKVSILFLFFYILILTVELYTVFIQDKSLEIIIKPFLMILLTVMYLSLTQKKNFWYIAVLLLSLIGDVLFIFRDDETYLTLAISILMIVHILYIRIIVAFLRRISVKKMFINLVPSLLIFALLLSIVTPFLGDFKVIIFLHVFFSLITMNISFINYLKKNSHENLYFFLSLFTLILADCFFALYRFVEPLSIYMLLVTLLYATAQFVICRVMIVKGLKK